MMKVLCEVLANIVFFGMIGVTCEAGWQIIRHFRAWRIGRRLHGEGQAHSPRPGGVINTEKGGKHHVEKS